MDAFMAFVGKFAGNLGAVVAAGNVVVGDRLGLYRGLAAGGPSTAEELAARTGTDARYVAEWLAGQAAGGYIEYADGRFSLTAEQALALADPAGPVDVAGAFTLALGALAAVPAVTEAFRTGAGIGWHEQSDDVFTGCERFFRAGYAAHLMQDWLRRNGQMAPDTSYWRTMMMPGMLTAAQLKSLEAAKGTEFDKEFLTLMIQHHTGALKMVSDLFATPLAGQDVDVSVFANDVVTVQTAEIGVMQGLLDNMSDH